ncbi:MAG: PDZ domain-containing protein [Ruminococcaceae bacterium]|nr:PDZ domain-containing protein [Oscillospiraceae bacterium]
MRKKIRAVSAVLLALLMILAVPLGVCAKKPSELIVAGIPFGVKFHMEGVIVAGIPSEQGPAAEAGIRRGDIITSIDGEPIASAEKFAEIIKLSDGKTLTLEYTSDSVSRTAQVTPCADESGEYKLGIWIKDSAAGIGTITFIDPETMSFAGLGHGICDSAGGEPLPFSFGSAEEVSLTGIVAGKAGAPGELRGSFAGHKIGKLLKNDLTGVYGVLAEMPEQLEKEKYPVCKSSEIKEGKAYIFATVDGEGRKRYEIEIFDIVKDGKDKNFSVRITDETLLAKTGGIVQGMSGSPIIQNDKIIGAVTHVLVNDPARGYGIFIENMLKAANAPLAKTS